jgi:hypothetical protein
MLVKGPIPATVTIKEGTSHKATILDFTFGQVEEDPMFLVVLKSPDEMKGQVRVLGLKDVVINLTEVSFD